jgi:small subunit ribosomal protein S2
MMRKVPDIVVIIDQKREHNAIAECQKLGIPVVSLLDTNCDPLVADVAIPANDDAIRSIKLIVGKLADAIYEGRHGQPDNQDDYDELEEGIDTDEYPGAEEEAEAVEPEVGADSEE